MSTSHSIYICQYSTQYICHKKCTYNIVYNTGALSNPVDTAVITFVCPSEETIKGKRKEWNG